MSRVGEFVQRKSVRAAAGVAGFALTLSGCGESRPLTEPIPNYPVPTTETVATSTLPSSPATTTTPPYQTYVPRTPTSAETSIAQTNPNVANSTLMRICFGGFYDKLNHTFTVNPPTQKLPDPSNYKNLVDFPMITHLAAGGNSSIEPAQPYRVNERAWIDERGNDMRTGSPAHCEDKYVRVATVNLVGWTGTQPALASPEVIENQVVDASTPGDTEKSGLYGQQFPCPNDATALNFARQLQAA